MLDSALIQNGHSDSSALKVGLGFIQLSWEMRKKAAESLVEDRPVQAADIENSYAAMLIAHSGVPVSFKLLPPEDLPQVAHDEHLVLKLSQGGIQGFARSAIRWHGASHITRLSLIGYLCGRALRDSQNDKSVEIIVDLGDGSDNVAYPRFSFCSSLANSILLPDPHFIESRGYEDIRSLPFTPWDERRNIVFWRGGTTGVRLQPPPSYDEKVSWIWLPRLHLCDLAKRSPHAEVLDIAVSNFRQIPESVVKERAVAAGQIKPPVEKSEFAKYRYQIDIDGNSNAWGLIEKLLMGSTILKIDSPYGFRQWFYDRLAPFETHVPIQSDFSDFDEKIDWVLSHPDQARQIAKQGAALGAELTFSRALMEAEARFMLGLATSFSRKISDGVR